MYTVAREHGLSRSVVVAHKQRGRRHVADRYCHQSLCDSVSDTIQQDSSCLAYI
jgi:hypothetical protein